MRILFIISAGLLVGAAVVDFAWEEVRSPVILFLFGIGWIGILFAAVFSLIQPRVCSVCRCTWSLIDLREISFRELRSYLQVCPECRSNSVSRQV